MMKKGMSVFLALILSMIPLLPAVNKTGRFRLIKY